MHNGDDHVPLGHPVPPEPWLYTRRFLKAAEVALVMHADQGRKGTTIPYASHRLGACSIVEARRAAYLAHLADADRSILLVSASDKLHNSRAVVADLRRVGDTLWERFSATKEDTLWYYRGLVTAFRGNSASPADLVDELDRVVTAMERLAGNCTPEGT